MRCVRIIVLYAVMASALVRVSPAQITISQSQFQAVFSPRKSLHFYQDTTSRFVDVGKRGGPNVYDFSGLPFFYVGRESVLAVSQIPKLASRYNSATAVLRFDNMPDGLEYDVFEIANQQWKNLGDVNFSSGDVERYHYYAPYEIDANFPITYGAATTHTFTAIETTYVNGVVTQANSTVLAESLIVDGYGTLKLPGFSLNCLRVRKKEYQNGDFHGFKYITQEGATLFVDSRSSQPDTGLIQVEGIFYSLGGSLSSVVRMNTQPATFSLAQNYPNPFNPSTTIRFSLLASAYVKLSVYNLLGQEIETLVNEKLSAGEFEVKWNAANQPSGVYLYRIQAGDIADVKKLILLR